MNESNERERKFLSHPCHLIFLFPFSQKIGNQLYKGLDIVRFIKIQTLQWTGLVERMTESKVPGRATKSQLGTRRRKGKLRTRD